MVRAPDSERISVSRSRFIGMNVPDSSTRFAICSPSKSTAGSVVVPPALPECVILSSHSTGSSESPGSGNVCCNVHASTAR